jgi:hypothetical protein
MFIHLEKKEFRMIREHLTAEDLEAMGWRSWRYMCHKQDMTKARNAIRRP